MSTLTVKIEPFYKIYFENDFENLEQVFLDHKLDNCKICIITDSNVSKIYLDTVFNKLKNISLESYHYIFKAGEESKNLDTVKEIYNYLTMNHFDRKSIIVALGGGVTGDIAGFVAATFMRGLTFIQVPTTLLSQVDSSVGGKVGVDFLQNKNLIGAFYQPAFVYANISTLKTLDKKQFSSGMGEVIKHGLILDKNYFNYILENKSKIENLDLNTMGEIIKGSCKIKSEIVSKDEKENGVRALLNFGHTFGHAFETLSNFRLTHGHSIALGMLCSLKYSLSNGFITEDDFNSVADIFNYFELYNKTEAFDADEILQQMYLDKKTKNNIIEIVYLKKIGEANTIKIQDAQILLEYIRAIS